MQLYYIVHLATLIIVCTALDPGIQNLRRNFSEKVVNLAEYNHTNPKLQVESSVCLKASSTLFQTIDVVLRAILPVSSLKWINSIFQ